MAGAESTLRVAIVAPTYNNARTLPHVLNTLATLNLPIFVVNDGSTDRTAEILSGWHGLVLKAVSSSPEDTALSTRPCHPEGVTVLTHPRNRGKAAAMRTGFEAARAAGFTHAVTIDTDGQHNASDIPALLAAAELNPQALVIGSRPAVMDACPLASNAGRRISNFFVHLEGGVRVDDSQCGLRIYPLAETLALPAAASRFGFETEIIIRFGWAQLPVVEVPVQCVYDVPGGRVTHFRRGPDTLAAMRMHARLLTRSLYLVPPKRLAPPSTSGTLVQRFLRWMNPATAWRTIRHHPHERPRYAVAFSVGVMIANLPLYGVQSILSLLVARRLRLPPLAVLAGSHVSTPPIGPLLIALAIGVGHWLLHGEFLSLVNIDFQHVSYLQLLRSVAADWIIGSLACGLAMAVLTYVLARLTLNFVPLAPTQASPH